jgi:hypothetical protein
MEVAMTHAPKEAAGEAVVRKKPWYRQLYVQVLVAIFYGNAVATLFVARWENGLDLARARRVLSGEIREDALAPVEEAPAPDADATAQRKQAAPPADAAELTVVVDEPPAGVDVPAARPAEDDEAVPANHR